MRPRVALLPLLAAAVLLASGCGGDGELDPLNPGDLDKTQQLITESDIGRYPQGSPQRGLLTWWRNVQFRNFAGYLQYFTAEARQTAAKRKPGVSNFLVLAGELRNSKPRIFRTVGRGDSATVYTSVAIRRPATTAGKDFTTTRVPQAFVMRRENGLWRLVDTVFVDLTVTPILEAKALQLQAQQQQLQKTAP